MSYFTSQEPLTYLDLKHLALSGRSKTKGKMINKNFRIYLEPKTGDVQLITRYNDKKIATTKPNDESTIHLETYDVAPWATNILEGYYGVRFETIKSNKEILFHNNHYISGTKENVKYVYIPSYVKVRDGIITYAAAYKKEVIDKEWNREYTRRSKHNRAAITALHKMIPFEEIDVNALSDHARYRVLNSYNVKPHNINTIIDIVLRTSNPNGNTIEYLRTIMNIHTKRIDIRTALQGLLNQFRYKRAAADGATTTISTPNIPI